VTNNHPSTLSIDDLETFPVVEPISAVSGVVTGDFSATLYLEPWMQSFRVAADETLKFDGCEGKLPWPASFNAREKASTPGWHMVSWTSPLALWRVQDGEPRIKTGAAGRCFVYIASKSAQTDENVTVWGLRVPATD
jgi:hypothetical protein